MNYSKCSSGIIFVTTLRYCRGQCNTGFSETSIDSGRSEVPLELSHDLVKWSHPESHALVDSVPFHSNQVRQ